MQDPYPLRSSHHRREHSDVNFRLQGNLDTFDAPFEDLGSEDDLFGTFIDIEKFGSSFTEGDGEKSSSSSTKPKHRHSNSVDGSSFLSENSIEAKKAMAPEKLAELWTLDPKRAKRQSR
nr:transcription factor RF2b-like [Tanacetum cinerariifolium]